MATITEVSLYKPLSLSTACNQNKFRHPIGHQGGWLESSSPCSSHFAPIKTTQGSCLFHIFLPVLEAPLGE